MRRREAVSRIARLPCRFWWTDAWWSSTSRCSSRQRDATARGDASPLKHRQVVLSLHTEELGQIDVQAALAGDRVRVNVHCDRAEAADFLSIHSTHLALDMEALDSASTSCAMRYERTRPRTWCCAQWLSIW